MNNRDDLKKFRAGMFDFEMREDKWIERIETSFNDLTVIWIDKGADAFVNIMGRIAAVNLADDFFTGNIGSLLDVGAQIIFIEI